MNSGKELLAESKMAECKAWGCKNNKRKNPEKHYFCVPKPATEEKKARVRQWLHNLGTGHTLESFTFGRNSVVCEDHFEARFFKRDLQAELLRLPAKHRLTEDAVPTIFIHRKETLEVSQRAQRQETRDHRQVKTIYYIIIYYLISN